MTPKPLSARDREEMMSVHRAGLPVGRYFWNLLASEAYWREKADELTEVISELRNEVDGLSQDLKRSETGDRW